MNCISDLAAYKVCNNTTLVTPQFLIRHINLTSYSQPKILLPKKLYFSRKEVRLDIQNSHKYIVKNY